MLEDGEEEAFSLDVKIQRGNGTDDRDTLKATVSADTLEELDEKVDHVQDRMGEWAVGFRRIQPSEQRYLDDDQTALDEVSLP
ncbi:MAG: DUF7389 domain-containing protein [Natronomonas sp.]